MNAERGEWASTRLPDGWNWQPFVSVFDDVTDSTRKLPQKLYGRNGAYPVIDQGEAFIGGYTDDRTLVHPDKPPFIVFGDHTRCIKYVDCAFVQGADGVKTLKPRTAIDPRYAYYALRAIALPDKGYSRHMKFLRASVFPVCPLTEQRRIAAHLDSLLVHSKKVREELGRIPCLVERYRQAVLSVAFGEEADKNPKILQLSELTEPQFPICYGVIQPGSEKDQGVPLIRVCDIEDGRIVWNSLRHVETAIDGQYSRSRVKDGDVIVSVVGTIGRIGLVSGAPEQVNIARANARIRPNKLLLSPKWLFYVLNCKGINDRLVRDAREVARKTLNLAQLKNLPISVPALDIQKSTVCRIDAAFEAIDRMAAEAKHALDMIDRLDRSTLDKIILQGLSPEPS